MNFEKRILPYLVVFSALSISLSAAFYSVSGLGSMYAGSKINVMIAMGALEIGKLVLASFLYQYWSKIHLLLKGYYIFALVILMAITSGGIYGFLSDAYSETSVAMQKQDKQISMVESKKGNTQIRLAQYQEEKKDLSQNITDLTDGLANNRIEYIDRETGEKISTTSSATRKVLTKQLEDAKERRDKVVAEIDKLSEEIADYDTQLLDIEYGDEVSSEIGILKAAAEITGKPVDIIIRWFTFAIMFVFDPLAISLVIGANIIFKERAKEEEVEDLLNNADDKIAEFESKKKEYEDATADFENRLKAIEDAEEAGRQRVAEMEQDILDKEDSIKKRQRDLDDMMVKINSDRDKSVEEIKKEKAKIKDLEYKLTEDRSKLAQEKDQFKKEHKSIENAQKTIDKDREELLKREAEIEQKFEKYREFHKKIQNWEKLHWKQRRNIKPPKL